MTKGNFTLVLQFTLIRLAKTQSKVNDPVSHCLVWSKQYPDDPKNRTEIKSINGKPGTEYNQFTSLHSLLTSSHSLSLCDNTTSQSINLGKNI